MNRVFLSSKIEHPPVWRGKPGTGRRLQGGLPPVAYRTCRDWGTSNKQAQHRAGGGDPPLRRKVLTGYNEYMKAPR